MIFSYNWNGFYTFGKYLAHLSNKNEAYGF